MDRASESVGQVRPLCLQEVCSLMYYMCCSILSNALLVLGSAFIVGGFKHTTQVTSRVFMCLFIASLYHHFSLPSLLFTITSLYHHFSLPSLLFTTMSLCLYIFEYTPISLSAYTAISFMYYTDIQQDRC
jgi:hypothetical protein